METKEIIQMQLKDSYLTNHQGMRPWEEVPNPNLWY